jgi:Domain of unknown function (DUF4386)
MTRTASARITGFAYLVYIAVGISNEVLMSRATSAEGTAATLTRIAEHATDVRVAILLKLLESLSAFVLGVALYGITREQDQELAMLGMVCRVAEGLMIASILVPNNLGLLWLASEQAGASPDVATTNALGAFLLPAGPIGAIFFAVGTLIFSYLLLRGRMIPASLAWLGVFSSGLLVVGLPLQLAGFLTGPLTGYQWVPEIVFTIVLALWLLIKGVAAPAAR